MPAKLLGVALVLAGLLLRHRAKRARRLGYVGPRYSRIHRETHPAKFKVAIVAQTVGALICFLGAILCFTHTLVR